MITLPNWEKKKRELKIKGFKKTHTIKNNSIIDESLAKSLTKKVSNIDDVSCPAIMIIMQLSTISSLDITAELSFSHTYVKQESDEILIR